MDKIKIDKKKYIDILIIFTSIILITLIGTYALKLWTSTENTELTFRIGDYTVESLVCKNGDDVNIENIGPVFDYLTDGEVISFSVVATKSNTKPLDINFNISTISAALKDKSFKYVLLSSLDKSTYNEEVKGDFLNATDSSNIKLIENLIPTTTIYYKLIIYIDGNMENPIEMQNGILTGNIEMCIEGEEDLIIDTFNVNGVSTTTFPLSSAYTIGMSCDDNAVSDFSFDYKSQSYIIGNINKANNAKCGINYTTNDDLVNLNTYIKGLAGTTDDNDGVVHEAFTTTTTTEGTGETTTSAITSYVSMNQYSSSSVKATSGNVINNYTLNIATGLWTFSASATSSTTKIYYHLLLRIPIKSNTQNINFNLTNMGVGYVLNIYSSDDGEFGNPKTTYQYNSSSSYSSCTFDSFTSNYLYLKVVIYSAGNTETQSNNELKSNNIVPLVVGGIEISTNISFSLTSTTTDTGTTTTTTTDTGYRYEGKNPNNYIYFNNELWRIIGVFNSSSHGVSNTYLTKIIRNDSIGGYAWNKSKTNNWVSSSLYNLLNNYYYNQRDGTSSGDCYQLGNIIGGNCDYSYIGLSSEYRNMVQEVTWYLGGPSSSDNTAATFYTSERDSSAIYSGNNANTTGYIGLMYASDYGYSPLSSNCARTINLGSYGTSACAGSSWLKKETNEWTITPNSSDIDVFNFSSSFSLINNDSIYGFATRPVLYLKSDVKKISGDGSISNPYMIGI